MQKYFHTITRLLSGAVLTLCFLLATTSINAQSTTQGAVAGTVTDTSGASVNFGKGDFLTFPRGLNCAWHITKPVRKHYRFK